MSSGKKNSYGKKKKKVKTKNPYGNLKQKETLKNQEERRGETVHSTKGKAGFPSLHGGGVDWTGRDHGPLLTEKGSLPKRGDIIQQQKQIERSSK